MSLLPYALARPFLFGMDPETAHELTLGSLERMQRTPLQWAYRNGFVPDPIELAGLRFPNRIGMAAGLDSLVVRVAGDGPQGEDAEYVGSVSEERLMARVIESAIAAVRLLADGPAPEWKPGGNPQGNASTGMGIKHEAREITVYDRAANPIEPCL